jgi:voltage-gated potassium channel
MANAIVILFFQDRLATSVLTLVDAFLTLFFLVDFVLRMAAAPSKLRYFFIEFGWADLFGSLWLPGWDILRVFRIYRVISIIRHIPEVSGGQPWRVARRERANSVFGSMILLAILVLEVGAVAVLHFESASSNANITTAGDALWWGIVTIATVGYGDKFPVTPGGRMVGVAEIIVGVALFSTIAAFLANAFISRRKQAEEQQAEEKQAVEKTSSQELLAEIQRLAAGLDQRESSLEARLARIEALLAANGTQSLERTEQK